MKTHLKQMIGAVLAFLFVLAMPSSHADDVNDLRYSAKVKVDISASDNINGVVSSYLKRELRSLTDVEIVENNPEWIINILVVELETVGGHKNGVAISTVITSQLRSQSLSELFQPKYSDLGLRLTSGLKKVGSHWLNIGSSNDLQNLCKEIVADFDTKHLEEDRKLHREMREEFLQVTKELNQPKTPARPKAP